MAPPRRGLTLVETIVLLAILAIGFGLLMPTTSHCGEAMRRTQCLNNMKQMGLAYQQFLNVKGYFPNAGTYGESPAALTSGNPSDSVINDTFRGRFALAQPGTPDIGPLYSWVVDILPYLGNENLYNDFNRERSYLDDGRPDDDSAHRTNAVIGRTDIGILMCPNDTTIQVGKGNLSYVVNLGFSRWHAEGHAYGWTGTATGGTTGPSLDWGQGVASQTGVMQLGTTTGKAPWDVKTTVESITDGLSHTILVSENVMAGASEASPYADGITTNWACPHPNFCGFVASDDVCTKGTGNPRNCSVANDLSEAAPSSGTGWGRANQRRSLEAINSGLESTQEGSSPFLNGLHPGLVVVGMCDGSSRTISASIDGAVFSKLVTPAGASLPPPYRQAPLGSGDY